MKIGQTSAVHFLSQLFLSLMGFLANLYLANVLGASVLGTYFLSVSVIIWLSVLGDFGIHQSLKKRLSEGYRSDHVWTASVVVQLTTLVVLSAGVVLFRGSLNRYVGAPIAMIVLVALWTNVAFEFVKATLDGGHKVHVSSLLDPANVVVRSVVQIVLTFAGYRLFGLFFGFVLGEVIALIIGLKFVTKRVTTPNRADFYRLIDFAKFSWISPVKGRSFLSMDTIILAWFVANSQIGVYEIAWNVAAIFAIFTASVGRAMFPEMSLASTEDDVDRIETYTELSLSFSGLLIIPGLVGSILLGEFVLSLYGPEFTAGYTTLIVLVCSRLVASFESQFTNTLNAVNRPELTMRSNLLFVGTNAVANVVLIDQFGIVGAAAGTTVATILSGGYAYSLASSEVSFTIPFDELARQAGAAVIMGVVVFAVMSVAPSTLVWNLGLICLGAVVYFLVLLALSDTFRTAVVSNVLSQDV
jgi:O-antigen/teichoic acid export membrane protein